MKPDVTGKSVRMTTKNGLSVEKLLGGRSNVYLLRDRERTMLVDTGPRRNRTRLQKRLAELHLDRIDCLLLTHIHYDHVGNAAFIAERYRAEIIVHRDATAFVNAQKNEPVAGVFPLTRIIAAVARPYLDRKAYESFVPSILCGEHYDAAALGFRAVIIATPGHSDCGLSLVVDDEIAIVSDTLFGVLGRSVLPPYAIDLQQLRNSWQKLLQCQVSLFLPGHGRPIRRERVVQAVGHDSPKT